MDKFKDNPRIVVMALIAAGIVALMIGSGEKKNNSNTEEVKQPETSSVTETEEQSETSVNESSDLAIGSTPQAGPVEVNKKDTIYSSIVRKGDNQTVIARQMVNDFLRDNSKSLSAEQRLYVETVIVDSLPRNDLIFVDQEIVVESSVIADAVDKSATLTEAQIARWSAYL